MKTFLALVVGIAIGAAGTWLYQGYKIVPARAAQGEPTVEPAHPGASGGAERIGQPNQPPADTVQEKLHSLKLSSEDIKDELAGTGRVIRSKAQQAGKVVSDATADTRATAAIKGKFVADGDLSALSISVNTTDGVVTLSGTVDSEDRIGKAMLLALETDNVQQVISTLQVRPK